MSSRLPALVILSPGFPENEADTTCLPAQQDFVRLLRELRPSLKVIVIAFQYPFTNKAYEWNEVPVLPQNGRNGKKGRRLLTWMRAWKALEKVKDQYHVIGIFSFWCTECALVGKWFGRRYGIIHRCWILGQDARAGNVFVRLVRPAADELVALSDFLADEFQRNYGVRPAHIIPNGIDPAMFGIAPVERTIDLLTVGSLIPLKQHDVFLEVVSQLKKTLPGVQGRICGKGPEEQHLLTLIRQLGLEDNVRLAGELPHPEVLRQMQQARILLHTSSYEGFSTVCLEALYAGAHVISFCQPMKAVISNWYIVNNPAEMIGKALELLRQPDNNLQVIPFSMRDSLRAVLRLFPYSEFPI